MKSSYNLHGPFVLCLMLAACGGDPEQPSMPIAPGGTTAHVSGGSSEPGGSSQALSCMPGTPRPCPCTQGGMGTQLCLATGTGYGPCEGCPPPPQADATTGTGALPDASEPMTSPEAGAPGNGSPSDSEDAGAMQPTQLPSGEGTSCGVGLPTLCALDTEKCCVRSLMTDTCIGASEPCECSVSDCETLEAHCDGPEDCADGQVCCGTLGGGVFGGSSYTDFECVDSCDYQGSQRIACHQGETECPGGNVCSNSQILTNLQVCIDPATIAQ